MILHFQIESDSHRVSVAEALFTVFMAVWHGTLKTDDLERCEFKTHGPCRVRGKYSSGQFTLRKPRP